MNASAIVCHVALAFNSRRFFIMTYTSKQKTFYAKEYEQALRQYFHCYSRTPKGKPMPYLFIPNKDKGLGIFRTKENGFADVFCKTMISDGKTNFIEERYLTFFPFYNNGQNGWFIDKKHWDNFINAESKSNDKNIWGVFCIDKDHFILISNKGYFSKHTETITCNDTSFDVYCVNPGNNGLYFTFEKRDKILRETWKVVHNNEIIPTVPDTNTIGLLKARKEGDKEVYCYPLPRQGSKHKFILPNKETEETTLITIANRFHGNLSVDSFKKKLQRNLEKNEKLSEQGFRLEAIKDIFIVVIPDDFDFQDVIDWQVTHPKKPKKAKKTEDMNKYKAEKLREYRKNR